MERRKRDDDQRPREKRRRETSRTQQEQRRAEATPRAVDDSRRSSRPRTSYNDTLGAPRQQGIMEASAGMSRNPLVVSTFPSTITHPLVNMNPPLATTSIPALGNNRASMPLPFGASQMNPAAEMATYQQARAALNAPSLGQAPQPLSLNASNLSPANLMRQQNLQTQQRLAAVAASQSLGGYNAANDPILLSALAQNLQAARPPAILGTNLPSLFASATIDPTLLQVPRVGLSPAVALLQSRQQQQSGLLLQNARQQQLLMGPLPPFDLQEQAAASLLLPRPILPSALPAHSAASRRPTTLVRPVRTAPLYMTSDEAMLSDHQILLRQQIEFFEARPEDIRSFTPGRRREISVGQVGIRCKHCAAVLPPHERSKGSVYFPSKLRALYQAAQNMGTMHFIELCPQVSRQVQEQLREYTENRAVSGHGGKQYWADGAVKLGIYETEQGLRFRNDI